MNNLQSAALYIRVSTDDQTEYSPDAQRHSLLKYAKDNGYIVTEDHIYVDAGISGRHAKNRPAFMRMISDAQKKSHPFSAVLVHKFDRFARSRADSAVYKNLLRSKCDVKVISITESIGGDDDKNNIILEGVLEAMGEFYSANLSDEVKKGMVEKAHRGEYQSAAPFGYRNEGKTLVIVPEEAKIVRALFDRYMNTNESMFALAKYSTTLGARTHRGNPFQPRTLKYIFRNPVYKGYARWGVGKADLRRGDVDDSDRIIVKGNWEAIIPDDLWEAVNDKLTRNTRPYKSRPRETTKHWLSGIISCGSCGAHLTVQSSSSGFQCWKYAHNLCGTSHYVSVKKIEASVIQAIGDLCEEESLQYQFPKKIFDNSEADLIRLSISKLADKEQRIKDSYISGIDTLEEYKENKERIKKERDELESQLSLSVAPVQSADTDDLMRQRVNDVYSIISDSNSSNHDKSVAIQSICSDIVYHKSPEKIDVFLVCK